MIPKLWEKVSSSEEFGGCIGMRIHWNKNLGASDPVGTNVIFLEKKAEVIPYVADVSHTLCFGFMKTLLCSF